MCEWMCLDNSCSSVACSHTAEWNICRLSPAFRVRLFNNRISVLAPSLIMLQSSMLLHEWLCVCVRVHGGTTLCMCVRVGVGNKETPQPRCTERTTDVPQMPVSLHKPKQHIYSLKVKSVFHIFITQSQNVIAQNTCANYSFIVWKAHLGFSRHT